MRLGVKTLGALLFFIILLFHAAVNLEYSYIERNHIGAFSSYDLVLGYTRLLALLFLLLAVALSFVFRLRLGGAIFQWKVFACFLITILLSLAGGSNIDDVQYSVVFISLIAVILIWYQNESDLRSMLRLYTGVALMVVIISLVMAIVSPGYAFLDGQRLNGAFSNPHTLGRMSAVLFITAQLGQKPLSPIVLACCALALVALLMSQSVNAILALALSMVLSFVYFGFGRTALISFLVVIVGLYFFAQDLVSYLLSFFGRDGTFSGRSLAWVLGVDTMSNAPLVGIGMRDTKDFIFSSSISSTNFHNNFIEIGVRAGLVSLFFFVWLNFRAFNAAASLESKNRKIYCQLIFLLVFLGLAQSTVFAFFTLDFYLIWSVLIALNAHNQMRFSSTRLPGSGGLS